MCGTAEKAWDQTVGKDSYVGGGGASDDIKKAASNVERNLRNTMAGTAMILQGDWSNADRTLLDLATMTATGGATTLINPDDTTNLVGKQTQLDRKVDEATAQQAADEAAAVQAEKDALNKQVSDMLKGVTEGQRRTPGRSQSLLGTGGRSGNTLLTPR